MIISPGRGYIFVHIPKTGGTSLTLALEARAKADDIIVADTPKGQRRRHRLAQLHPPGRLWKHSMLADIDGMVGLPKPAFVFTLVRNPWDRVASFYHWARAQRFDHPLVQVAQARPFDQFLACADVQRALSQGTAASYVTDRSGTLRCDAFVRLEHLAADLHPVEAHLGFKLAVPHANASAHPASADLYTDSTRDLVQRVCADDIQRFSYSFPG